MSETTNLKLLKHDNPETNEEQFDIENYLNGNWDKINENAKKTNNQILQLETEKAKLETELKEMQKDIYQSSIRGQASGEYIHVKDSNGARCKIGIYGNSEQETRSGKNLFKPLNITSNGITTTYDKDGVGTIKGTSTNTWANISANVIYLYPAGNYVLSIDEPKTFNINLKGIYTDEEIFEFVIPAGSKTKNVAFKKEVYSMYAFISGLAAGTTLDDTIKIQLEKGSTATDFEQYGLMPSPDYPSEIKTVGSNVNLLDKSKFVFNRALNNDTGEIRTSTSGNWYGTEEYIDFRKYAGKTISLSNRTTVAFYDTNKKFISSIAATQSPTGIVPQNTAYIRADVYKDYYDVVKLVEGAEAGEYSSYGQGSVKVTKCNKNLSKYKLFTSTSSAKLVADTTTSGQQIEGIKMKKGKTYTVSFDVTVLPTSDYRIQIKECIDKNVIQTSAEIPNLIQNEALTCNILKRYSKTVTAYGDNYLYIRCVPNGFTLDNIQIEENSTPTPYEEHQEQSYIMPTQQEMLEEDYFDFDNEEEMHEWTKYVFTGEENWFVSKATTNLLFVAVLAISNWNAIDGELILSNRFVYHSVNKVGSIYIFNNGISLGLCFDASMINSIEQVKKYLKENITYCFYKTRTVTKLPFTDEQKSVAKELNNARTYKNVTNITTDSKAILDLDYVKDQETQNQKMQNEIDEIKQLLSTTQTSAMLLDNLQKEVESEVE